MNKKVEYVKKTIYKIIDELRKEEYDIDKESIKELLDVINKVQIFFDSDKDIYTFSEENKKYKYNLPEKMSSCVLEFCPLKSNDKFININPILYLVEFKDEDVFLSVLYHEICHLLSIGNWEKLNNNEIQHISGIREIKYMYEDTVKEEKIDINDANEEINDWVAKKLYEKLEKRKYCHNGRKQYERCQNYIQNQIDHKLDGDSSKMIGYYFRNDLDKLKNVLLTEQYKSLTQLNEYFIEKAKDYDEER